mmetsp:Transcript_20645/g.35258  ORF Transcript_20645/g.35258 Transcript_20645/m.35258 type:complete len:236 (-) Transcript_20645:321-1028(-)
MPFETMPAIGLGFRLHITVTRAPCTSSSFMWCASPERIWRGPSASPTSICSTYSLSLCGCGATSVITPTRTSAQDQSIGRSSTGAAPFSGAAFFSLTFFSVLNTLPSGGPPLPPAPFSPLAPLPPALPLPSTVAAGVGAAAGAGAVPFLPAGAATAAPVASLPFGAALGGGDTVPARMSAASASIAARVLLYGASAPGPCILVSSAPASSGLNIFDAEGFSVTRPSSFCRGMTWK